MPIAPARKPSVVNPDATSDVTAALLVLAQTKMESSGVSDRGAIVERHQELKALLEK